MIAKGNSERSGSFPTAFPTSERDSLRTERTLDRIFGRQRGAYGPRDFAADQPRLLAAIGAGRAQARLLNLPIQACEGALASLPETRGNESIAHASMKLAAESWMVAEGADDASHERRYPAGKANVLSASHAWVVEVGHTPVGKLAALIGHPLRYQFTLIPYQKRRWHDGSARRLIAIDFAWDPTLAVEAEQRERARCAEDARALGRVDS